ncbi:glucokinase [Clostridia bacterium]|nr:glucokinase [Clostridia bacterium]
MLQQLRFNEQFIKSVAHLFFQRILAADAGKNMARNDMILAVDIGGTKTALGLVGSDDRLSADAKIDTVADFGALVDKVYGAADALLRTNGLTWESIGRAGIACPGPLNIPKGLIVNVATTGWKNIPITRLFRERLGRETFLINDCKAAALGEYRFGAGKGCPSMAYMTVSTGIGGALVLDGRLHDGRFGNAGEFGHLTAEENGLPCGCGKRGCLELYASGTAIARVYGEKTGEKRTAKEIGLLARRGDGAASETLTGAAVYLGRAIATVFIVAEPELLVIGGGVSRMYDLMRETVEQTVAAQLPRCYEKMTIRTQALDGNQNLYGAAICAKEGVLH